MSCLLFICLFLKVFRGVKKPMTKNYLAWNNSVVNPSMSMFFLYAKKNASSDNDICGISVIAISWLDGSEEIKMYYSI